MKPRGTEWPGTASTQASTDGSSGDCETVRGAWFTVTVLTIANVFAYLDRQVLGLLVVPIKEDLNLSDTEIGVLIGFAFALFYSFFGVPLGKLVDHSSRRIIVSLGIAAWSIATAACGLARSFFGLFAARVGVGVGEAALAPAAYSMIGDLFPAERRGLAIAVYTTGASIGSGAAVVMAAVVFSFLERYEAIHVPGLGQVAPWQMVFFAIGLPGLLLSAVALSMKEPRRTARSERMPDFADLISHLRQHAVLFACLTLGFSLLAVKAYGISAWIPTFLVRTHGFSVGEAGVAFGLVITVTATIGILAGGVISDRLATRGRRDGKILVALVSNLLTLVPIVAYPLVSSATLSLTLIGLYFLFAAATTPMGVAALQEMTPPRLRGQVSALYLFAIVLIGMGVGPVLVAVFTEHVFGDPLALRYSLAVVPVITISLAMVLLLVARGRFARLGPQY